MNVELELTMSHSVPATQEVLTMLEFGDRVATNLAFVSITTSRPEVELQQMSRNRYAALRAEVMSL
jgi:hypothetical protein